MDDLIFSLPRAVEQATRSFLDSNPKSEREKIAIATLDALAKLAPKVEMPEHQDLMIGAKVKSFFRANQELIANRANGQMGNLTQIFLALSGASYGKSDFHDLVCAILCGQLELAGKCHTEEPKIIAYGVMQNLVNLVLDTKTEKGAEKVQELLAKIAPDDKKWQEMISKK